MLKILDLRVVECSSEAMRASRRTKALWMESSVARWYERIPATEIKEALTEGLRSDTKGVMIIPGYSAYLTYYRIGFFDYIKSEEEGVTLNFIRERN